MDVREGFSLVDGMHSIAYVCLSWAAKIRWGGAGLGGAVLVLDFSMILR